MEFLTDACLLWKTKRNPFYDSSNISDGNAFFNVILRTVYVCQFSTVLIYGVADGDFRMRGQLDNTVHPMDKIRIAIDSQYIQSLTAGTLNKGTGQRRNTFSAFDPKSTPDKSLCPFCPMTIRSAPSSLMALINS